MKRSPWLVRMTTSAALAALAVTAAPRDARAFCGFYVGGADTKLFNNATVVVMMREGQKTVLSMQNNYQGPPQDFAMVVPVPVVLQKENVKTLPRELFDRVDALTAPRLVEYWEQDPCAADHPPPPSPMLAPMSEAVNVTATGGMRESHSVKIEARFSVGEYDILVLSAKDSSGLDTWLHENGYKIPSGAEPLLRPYVQMGMKFFVAKIDAKKVAMKDGMAMLSPLRFHYDADAFFLPIRLGLVNSGGTQDLVVNVLARGQRFEVANYDNVSIPTNLELAEEAKGQFGATYAALFDKTIARSARTVVTEYAWEATSCDPCPTPSLDEQELMTLGADVATASSDDDGDDSRQRSRGFVVTRLHLRYAKGALGDDLFFRAAHAIEGGRERSVGVGVEGASRLEQGARPGDMNNFQARYVIRHPWVGDVKCAHPRRGIWGGPNGAYMPVASPATNLAFAPRGRVQLAALIKSPIPDGEILSEGAPTPPIAIPRGGSCAGCQAGGGGVEIAGGIFGTMTLLGAWRRRRSARSSLGKKATP